MQIAQQAKIKCLTFRMQYLSYLLAFGLSVKVIEDFCNVFSGLNVRAMMVLRFPCLPGLSTGWGGGAVT